MESSGGSSITNGTDTSTHSVKYDLPNGGPGGSPQAQQCPPSPPQSLISKPINAVLTRENRKGSISPTTTNSVDSVASRAGSLSPRSKKNLLHSPSLRSNLTREQRDRDPLFFYEIVKTLGVGSMGSVSLVQKRKNVVGGSARKDIQEAVQRQKSEKACLQIPVIGGLFRFCIDGSLKHKSERGLRAHHRGTSSFGGSIASWFSPTQDILTMSNGSSKDGAPQQPNLEDAPPLPKLSSSPNLTTDAPSTTSSGNPIQYAMKSIHLKRVSDNAFLTELRNEIAVLRQLDHPHIVRPIETFELRNQIFIIMELCSGGDLYSRDPYTEEEAARIVSSILSAIAYMHSKNILHRDLKYENVLFVNDSPKAEVKIIDFGLSKVYGDNTELTEGVGTIYTMAPEVLHGYYTAKCDIWSIGVITFMLLSSQMPFYGRKRRHIVEQILNAQFDFRGRRWKRISKQAKAFIEDLLVLDPEDRCDASTALRATWLNRRFAATTRGPDAEEESMARAAMLRYAGYTKLKKMALMVVAHKSSSEEIGILRKVFQKYDTTRDGCICYEDFCNALSEFGHSDEDLKEMFDAVDLDGTGKIRYTEFLAATIEAQGAISEERLAEAFDRLDSDDSGYISAENLAEILGQEFPKEEIEEIIADAGLTDNNRVSYADFLHLWEEKKEQERNHQLQMLGAEVLSAVKSEGELNSFRDSSLSLYMADSDDEKDNAEARATFVLEKHDTGNKKVGFASTVEEIAEEIPLEQTHLE